MIRYLYRHRLYKDSLRGTMHLRRHRWSGETIHIYDSHTWSKGTTYGNKYCHRWSGEPILGGPSVAWQIHYTLYKKWCSLMWGVLHSPILSTRFQNSAKFQWNFKFLALFKVYLLYLRRISYFYEISWGIEIILITANHLDGEFWSLI